MRKTLILLSALALAFVPAVSAHAADRQPPKITITSPKRDATYTLNEVVTASYSCTDNRRVETCVGTMPNGQRIATSTAGSFTFSVTATDNAGNTATQQAINTVQSASAPGSCSAYYALTFDDGPNTVYTPQVKAALDSVGAKATFFLVGQEVNAAPDLARLVAGAGNWVANHTYTHPDLTTLTSTQVRSQLSRTNDAIRAALSVTPSLLPQFAQFARPPYGEFNNQTLSVFDAFGLNNAIWTIDTNDWQGLSVSAIVAEAVKVQPGGIILMHDAYPYTVTAVPQIVNQLKQRGMCPGKLASVSPTRLEALPAWPGVFFSVVAVNPFPVDTPPPSEIPGPGHVVVPPPVSLATPPTSSPDTVRPTITLSSPTHRTYRRGRTVRAKFTCSDNVKVVKCRGTVGTGARINTRTRGRKTFKVVAIDAAGNAKSMTLTYRVR